MGDNSYNVCGLEQLKERLKPGVEYSMVASTMLDNLACGVAVYEYKDSKVSSIYLNEMYYEVVGYTREEYIPYINNVTAILTPEGEREVFAQIKNYLRKKGSFYAECLGKKPDGTDIWYLVKGSLIDFIESKNPVFLAVIQDITERKNKSLEDAINKERYNILEEATTAVLFDYDVLADTMVFLYKLNNATTETRKLRHYSTLSKKAKLVHPDDEEKFFAALKKACTYSVRATLEYRTTVIDLNEFRWARTTYSSVADDAGRIVKILGRIEDIDEQQRERQRMTYLAEIDFTTGLYNKLTAMTRIQNKIDEHSGKGFFAVIDIDDFKNVNDDYGHSFGDKVLLTVAKSIRKVFPNAIIGRFGGDEYIMYITSDEEREVIRSFGEFLDSDELSGIDGTDFDIRCSVGISWTDCITAAYHDYFNHADAALYEAKKKGKNCMHIEKFG